MRFTKVLLITPPVKSKIGPIRPNIGLGYIAQVLEDHNIEYDILDMLLGYKFIDLKNKIEKFKPQLIGISMFSNGYKTAYEILAKAKALFPSIFIVAGGPHISCMKKTVLEQCDAIDYAIYLEGEFPLLELCRGAESALIPNLIYRKNGALVENQQADFIKELDMLPFPRYSKFEISRYIEEKSLISSRGCPYQCIYCAVKRVTGMAVRLRSPNAIVDEIEYWYLKGVRQFSFQDDNFISYKKRLMEICDEISNRQIKGVFFRCAGARADKLDKDILEKMVAIGFKTIAIGVEVGNDRMLKIIKKGETFENIDRGVKLAAASGMDVYLNFLAGSPFETEEDIHDGVRFALKYPIFYAEWANIIPYPGTELYDWVKQQGYLLKDPSEYLNSISTGAEDPVFETPELPLLKRRKILRYLKTVRKKILQRSLARRLRSRGIPGIISELLAYIVGSEMLSKYLFQLRLRKIADRIRYSIYMKKR